MLPALVRCSTICRGIARWFPIVALLGVVCSPPLLSTCGIARAQAPAGGAAKPVEFHVVESVEASGFPVGSRNLLVSGRVTYVAVQFSGPLPAGIDWRKDLSVAHADGSAATTTVARRFVVQPLDPQAIGGWKLFGEAPARFLDVRIGALSAADLQAGQTITVETPAIHVCGALLPANVADRTWREGEGAKFQNRLYLVFDVPLEQLQNCGLRFRGGLPVSLNTAARTAAVATNPPATTTTTPVTRPSGTGTSAYGTAPTRAPTTNTVGRTPAGAPPSTGTSQVPRVGGATVAARPYRLPEISRDPPPVPAGAVVVGHGGRGNAARFDEAWNLIHQQTPNYEHALHLLKLNIHDNPTAVDIDYEYGWAMFAAAKLRRWDDAAAYYEVVRRRFAGNQTGGNDGTMRNWQRLLTEVKQAAARASSQPEAKRAVARMTAADG